MVDFGSGPVKEHIDNTVFIIPGIIIVVLLGGVAGKSGQNQTHGSSQRAREMEHDMNSYLFLGFLLVVGSVIVFFAYKLGSSLWNKHKLKEEKKKQKQQKREKETMRKQKKK